MQVLERGEAFTRHHQVQGKRLRVCGAARDQAAQRLYNDAGGQALYTDSELQRKFRDATWPPPIT
jgi:hypothetical protein